MPSPVVKHEEKKKHWGVTRCIFTDKHCELHHATSVRKGYCSKHKHVTKPNMFYVLQGTLEVETFAKKSATSPVRTDTVLRGQSLTIPAGVWHRFRALTEVDMIEFYWSELDREDIVRADEGGVEQT